MTLTDGDRIVATAELSVDNWESSDIAPVIVNRSAGLGNLETAL
jgi:hypothetical protein